MLLSLHFANWNRYCVFIPLNHWTQYLFGQSSLSHLPRKLMCFDTWATCLRCTVNPPWAWGTGVLFFWLASKARDTDTCGFLLRPTSSSSLEGVRFIWETCNSCRCLQTYFSFAHTPHYKQRNGLPLEMPHFFRVTWMFSFWRKRGCSWRPATFPLGKSWVRVKRYHKQPKILRIICAYSSTA